MKATQLFLAIGIVIAIGIFTSGPSAKMARASDKAPPFAIDECARSLQAMRQGLDRLDAELKAWAKAQGPRALAAPELDKSREGRQVLLYGAYLLPKDAPFADVYQDCWSIYADFASALKAGDAKDAAKRLRMWNTCVDDAFDPFPAEAEELSACWKKSQR